MKDKTNQGFHMLKCNKVTFLCWCKQAINAKIFDEINNGKLGPYLVCNNRCPRLYIAPLPAATARVSAIDCCRATAACTNAATLDGSRTWSLHIPIDAFVGEDVDRRAEGGSWCIATQRQRGQGSPEQKCSNPLKGSMSDKKLANSKLVLFKICMLYLPKS